MNFILEGLDLEVGSTAEFLALRAFKRRQEIEWLKVRTIVETISYVGQSIAGAVVRSDAMPGPDKLNDMISLLRGMMLPELAEDTEAKAQKVKEIMERELAQGPFKVEGMQYKR